MDGNKRWSKLNNKSIKHGYLQGINSIKETINICLDKNIKYLTLYALSTENTKRTSVGLIFKLIISEYLKFLKEINLDKKVKINFIGEKKGLSKKILSIIDEIHSSTINNKKLQLNIAFNYGSDMEILSIIKNIYELDLKSKNEINMKLFKKFMYLNSQPDPDILIRTGGFKRLSNFLLLNLNYTELFFIDNLWPNFNKKILLDIVNDYKKIERNYGL